MAQDHFSKQAAFYKKFRPHYPIELFDWIDHHIEQRRSAWDIACGSGQLTQELSLRFDQVLATDLSKKQLEQAPKLANVRYQVDNIDASAIEGRFDCITVGQAIHWFNHDRFFAQAQKCLHPGGLLLIAGYDLLSIRPDIDIVIKDFYENTIGAYWPAERQHIDNAYADIPFPCASLAMPNMYYQTDWTLEQLIGYLNSWSAVQHYKNAHNHNPVDGLSEQLAKLWDTDYIRVRFPLLLWAAKAPW